MAKRKAAPKYVWVSRRSYHEVERWNPYEIHEAKDDPPRGSGWKEILKSKFITEFSDLESFEALTGITLKLGECRRFEWRSPLVAIKRKGKVK